MSEAEDKGPKLRPCACDCGMAIEPHRPRATYRIGHRQRALRRRHEERHAAFWGRFGRVRRRRPAVRSPG